MKLEAGKEMDRKCVLDWLNEVYISPSASYSKYTDEKIRMFAHDALVLLEDYEVLKKQHEISNELLELNRRTGKWIEEEPNCYTKKTYCSVCKEPAPFIAVGGDYYGRNMHGKTEKTKYCPNCGARMTL